VAATALGVGYAALRSRLPGASAGYERGYADTVLRYADRSYEGAKWTRLKETASLAALVGAGEYSAAGLWRVAGWDADNLWVANEYGHLFHLRDGHWRYAGRPEHARRPWVRVLDPDTALVGGGERLLGRRLYRLSPGGTEDLGDLDFCNSSVHVELFPAERGVTYCYTSEMPHLNGGAVRFADGVRTVLREDGYKEAFVHDPDNTPLNDHPVRFLQFTRSHRAGAGYAVSPASTRGVVWGKRKLVRFDAGTWYAVADLPDREPRDVWVTGPAAAPVVVLVGANGWVHVRPAGATPGADRTPAAPPEPTPMRLIKVWGASPDKFWVMDEAGSVWEFAGAESRVVVRGLRREDVTFRDAWVAPTGAVFAVTDKHLYRLD